MPAPIHLLQHPRVDFRIHRPKAEPTIGFPVDAGLRAETSTDGTEDPIPLSRPADTISLRTADAVTSRTNI
jgi:hypothetical protein